MFREKSGRRAFARRELKRSILPDVLLAVHFIIWIIGARMTPPNVR
jgi:hypothetical protein